MLVDSDSDSDSELEPLPDSEPSGLRSNVIPSGHCAGRRGPAGPPAAPRRATARTHRQSKFQQETVSVSEALPVLTDRDFRGGNLKSRFGKLDLSEES